MENQENKEEKKSIVVPFSEKVVRKARLNTFLLGLWFATSFFTSVQAQDSLGMGVSAVAILLTVSDFMDLHILIGSINKAKEEKDKENKPSF